MKTLYLLRHAKSSWDDLTLRDKDRTLNERGRAAARDMGLYLADSGPLPDLILCSPAVRTRETADRFLAAIEPKIPVEIPVEIIDPLYNCSDSQMLSAIRSVSDDHDSLMVVAHYPAIPALAVALCGPGHSDQEDLHRLARKYPTAALAEISLAVEKWTETDIGSGDLQRFIRPRSLAKSLAKSLS